MTHAARRHHALDAARAEAMARDGKPRAGARFEPGHGGALLPSRSRLRDLRTMNMNRPRVLLTRLSIRTSAKGNTYLSGWLGQASVIGFKAAEPDRFGNAVWEIFVSEPDPRPGTMLPDSLRQQQERASAAVASGGSAELDDPVRF